MGTPTGCVAIILGALGDFILSLPLLCALRQRGALAVWTRGPYRALLPQALAADPFVDIDGSAGASLFAAGVPLPEPLANLVTGAEVHAFMAAGSDLERRLLRVGAGRLVWHATRPAAPPHIALRFLTEAGLDAPSDLLAQPVMPRRNVGAAALWLHPGSGSPAKSIPPLEAASLARQTLEPATQRLIVSFGEADLGLRRTIQEALARHGLRAEELVCPSLGELRRRLEQEAAAFIGPDTGVSHLAAALGIPVTAVFRATDPAIWRPVGNVRVVRCP